MQPNHPLDERQLWPSTNEEETMVVMASTNEAGSDVEEVVTESTPKTRKPFLSILGKRILSAGRKLRCCSGGS